jgi:hypothetical protein
MPTLKQKLEMAQAAEVKPVAEVKLVVEAAPKKKRNYPANRKPATKRNTVKKSKDGDDAK